MSTREGYMRYDTLFCNIVWQIAPKIVNRYVPNICCQVLIFNFESCWHFFMANYRSNPKKRDRTFAKWRKMAWQNSSGEKIGRIMEIKRGKKGRRGRKGSWICKKRGRKERSASLTCFLFADDKENSGDKNQIIREHERKEEEILRNLEPTRKKGTKRRSKRWSKRLISLLNKCVNIRAARKKWLKKERER